MNNNILKFLEITWLVIAVFAFAAGIYTLLKISSADSYIMFGISVISLFMYFFRRNLRKSREK